MQRCKLTEYTDVHDLVYKALTFPDKKLYNLKKKKFLKKKNI